MITKIDTQVGQIADLLRELGIKDNTLLFLVLTMGLHAGGNRLAVVVLCAGKKGRCMKAVCARR